MRRHLTFESTATALFVGQSLRAGLFIHTAQALATATHRQPRGGYPFQSLLLGKVRLIVMRDKRSTLAEFERKNALKLMEVQHKLSVLFYQIGIARS